jgi:hypothetical protein
LFVARDTFLEVISDKLTENCDSLTTNRDACFNSAAQKKKDPVLCDKISVQSSDPRGDSKDNCYSNVAEALLKPELCQNIQKTSGDGSRDTCYLNIATKTKNINLCANLAGQYSMDIQGSQVFVNKDFCIQNVAMESLDASLCDQISVKVHNPAKAPLNVSTQSCYAFVGQNSKNASLCEKAGALKSACIEGVNQK